MASIDLTPEAVLDLTLYRGDDSPVQVEIYHDAEQQQPWVLPTSGWLAQLRRSQSSASPVIGTIAVDAADAANGVLRLTFPHLATGAYVYDVQCSEGRVQTWVKGFVTVESDVTHEDD